MASKFERASEVVVSRTPEGVWRVISNPNNFDQLFIPGMSCAEYEESDYMNVKQGSILKASSGTKTSDFACGRMCALLCI